MAFCVAGCDSATDERLGVWVAADLGDGDAVDRRVGLAVAAPVEAVPFGVG